jgi:hypothetical protein
MNVHEPLFDHRAIFDYYADGHSLSECQKSFGCSYRTAKRAILKWGTLRSVKEGVRLKDSRISRTPHSLATRQRLAAIALQRSEGQVRVIPYRVQRSKHLHPILGISEKAWHRWLITKADYICVVTGQRGCRLAVHHLYSVNRYPEKRWDESNTIVITKELHDIFHQRFMGNARKPCTPDDWKRFLLT